VRRRGPVGRLLALFFIVPRVHMRSIDLDEIGSFVWARCDGATTVRQIRKALVDRYKLHQREAEASLLEYLRQMMKRNLLGLEVIRKDGAGNP